MLQFEPYTPAHYQKVCDFLIELNREKNHINWNWARWEWMYAHPYFDREQQATIGLWMDGARVAGVAIYDLYFGEAFCAALEGYHHLLGEIWDYAYRRLKDAQGLGLAVRDGDHSAQERLAGMGYRKTEQTETVMFCKLDGQERFPLPDGFLLRELRFPEDNLAYQTVIWKGFDHEGDREELDRMLSNSATPPNRRPELCLAAVDAEGEFAAHCTCWYDERTDYAYVEPVCTIPKYRGMGLGKAVVREALRRCRLLGAKQAFVISDQEFYRKLGFRQHSQYVFYHRP